ncbi:hypothetical protein EMIT0232MI5_130077 [Pseudomonas sp. IT-232MI5]
MWQFIRPILQDQKIVRSRPEHSAAPTFEMHSPVGAAEGCDLLIFIYANCVTSDTQPLSVITRSLIKSALTED